MSKNTCRTLMNKFRQLSPEDGEIYHRLIQQYNSPFSGFDMYEHKMTEVIIRLESFLKQAAARGYTRCMLTLFDLIPTDTIRVSVMDATHFDTDFPSDMKLGLLQTIIGVLTDANHNFECQLVTQTSFNVEW
jgi:hypothetical protein